MRLTVNGVGFSYGSDPVLRDVDLTLNGSEILGIVGPNGSGKTTLIKCINHILIPMQGEILIDGMDITKMKNKDLAKHTGYVPQNSGNSFSSPTVYEVVMMGRHPHSMGWQSSDSDDNIVWEALKELEVEEYASRQFHRLSSGQTQRVLIARALAQEASTMLLDEPTSNLDIKYQIEVMDLIKRLARDKGVGAIAIIHDMDMAMRYCDKVVMLNLGVITAAGKAEDVLTPENIMRTYGVEVAIDRNYGRSHVIIL